MVRPLTRQEIFTLRGQHRMLGMVFTTFGSHHHTITDRRTTALSKSIRMELKATCHGLPPGIMGALRLYSTVQPARKIQPPLLMTSGTSFSLNHSTPPLANQYLPLARLVIMSCIRVRSVT